MYCCVYHPLFTIYFNFTQFQDRNSSFTSFVSKSKLMLFVSMLHINGLIGRFVVLFLFCSGSQRLLNVSFYLTIFYGLFLLFFLVFFSVVFCPLDLSLFIVLQSFLFVRIFIYFMSPFFRVTICPTFLF